MEQGRDCHGNVSQREEHSNEKVGPEAYEQRKVDKLIISGSGCLRKSEKLTHDGSTCFAYKSRAAGAGVVNVPRDPTLALPNTFLLSSNMPPRGSNERLDFTPILTHYLFLFTSVFAVVSLLPLASSRLCLFLTHAKNISLHGLSLL